MFFHPRFHFAEHDRDVIAAALVKDAAEHRRAGAGHEHLEGVISAVDAAGGGEVGFDMSVKNGDPAQGQAAGLRGAEQDVVLDFEGFEVDIGLVEPVKQNSPFGAGFV